jgi:polar amino acid transport system permease protein
MFSFCADPSTLSDFHWFACYLTTVKHGAFYSSFFLVIAILITAALLALGMGFLGAMAKRSDIAPLRWIGTLYTSIVRGVPEVIFFLFVPIALDQGFEWARHKIKCADVLEPIRRGNDFVPCAAAKLPTNDASPFVHDLYGIFLALIAFALVFGAYAANIIDGAMRAVPKGQLEAAQAVGMSKRQVLRRVHVPQMWRYALPGLSNTWQVLVKASPLLFLLGIQDVVYWARELGGSKTSAFTYPHGDWRAQYFFVIMIFYLLLTIVSQRFFDNWIARLSIGQTHGRAR